MQCLEPSSTAGLSGAAQAQFVTRDGDGLLCLPITFPGPTEMVPFPFSLPQGWSLHVSGGVHSHREPFLGGKSLVYGSREYQCDKCWVIPCSCKTLEKDDGGSSPWGTSPRVKWMEAESFPSPDMWAGFVLFIGFCFLCSVFISEAGAGSLTLL